MIAPFKKLELLFWSLLPAAITFALVILVLTPKHLGALSSVMPMLPLMPVFYWGMLHARAVPYILVFLVGLFMDAATGAPLGLSSLVYMLFLGLLRAQRKYIHKEGFIIKWAYFAVLLLAICIVNWVMMSLLLSAAQDIGSALAQWILSVCCYPIFHAAFDALGSRIGERRWRLLHS